MNFKLGEDLAEYIKTRAERKVAVKEFLNLRNMGLPENIESAKSRIIINYGIMCGNYIWIIAGLLCIYLFIYPILFIPGIISGAVIYLVNRETGDDVIISGASYKKKHLCIGAGILSLLFLVFMPRCLVSLFFILGVGTIISVGHMVAFKPQEPTEEV